MKLNFFTVLFMVFLVLKLTGVIDWSWWLITIPLYPAFFFLVAYIVLLIISWFQKIDLTK